MIKLILTRVTPRLPKTGKGDIFFYIEPEDHRKEQLTFYLDLWQVAVEKPNTTLSLIAAQAWLLR